MGGLPSGPDAPGVVPHDADAPERPRLPYAVAAFALACVVCATWLWMRYSYVWAVSTDDLARGLPLPHGSYVRIEADPRQVLSLDREWGFVGEGVLVVELGGGASSARLMLLIYDGEITTPRRDELFPLVGRVIPLGVEPTIKIAAVAAPVSRFAPESVAGLVVAAMGAGVFALYLRRWLAERRALRTRPRAAA